MFGPHLGSLRERCRPDMTPIPPALATAEAKPDMDIPTPIPP